MPYMERMSFNRTIVELKCIPRDTNPEEPDTFNRTIVELK